ncbi:hypothetical protein BDB00DRAFT_819010 [Zychaea mexicana]|uniref:uncharacterized protein n=1 Tax=Zychaea mexicana TaxID=64656 RepID=UPI0022FDF9BD|nr:uncharacterized protein BDB00DRAFT_819010 [Zychaea mexicana]KAI9494402.1 hypothetical protein BDB00DRAFT_819010 [Zychaea mexicana]
MTVEVTQHDSDVESTQNQPAQEQKWPQISVSKLAQSFYYHCEEHVKLTMSAAPVKVSKEDDSEDQEDSNGGEEDKAPLGVRVEDASTEAHFQRGNTFEEVLMQQLSSVAVDHTHTPTAKSKQVLREAKVGQVLCQLSFEMPKGFYASSAHDNYRLRRFIPDFLWTKEDPSTKTRTIFVIDAKSSRAMNSYHQFQVASYAYLLEYIVKDIRNLEIDPVGGVWLPSNILEPETFRIDLMMPKMKFFYTVELPAIIASEQTSWLYSTKCKTCEYTDICCSQAYGTPGAVAYMTDYKVKALQRRRNTDANSTVTMLGSSSKTTRTDSIDELTDRLQNLNTDNTDDIEDLMSQFNKIKIKDHGVPVPDWMVTPEFQPYIDAYKTQKPQFRGNPTVSLAEKNDHDIFVSFAYDPMYRSICAYSIRVYTPVGNVLKELDCNGSVAYESRSSPRYKELAVSLVTDLVLVLNFMNGNNSCCTLYVASSQAKHQLRMTLLEVATRKEQEEKEEKEEEEEEEENHGDKEDTIRQKAMDCLLVIFQDTQLLTIPGVDAFPTELEEVTVPRLVDLERLVQENIALGVPGFYTLTDMLHWLCTTDDDEEKIKIKKNDTLLLDEAGLYDRWHEQDNISQHLITHTRQLQNILLRYRELAIAYKENTMVNIYCLKNVPFVWSKTQKFRSPLLGRLAFFKKLECVSGCDNVRSARIGDLTSPYAKSSLHLVFRRWEVIPNSYGKKDTWLAWFDVILDRFTTSIAARIQMDSLVHNSFKEYMLVNDTREGILEAIRFPDLKHRKALRGINESTLVNVDRVSETQFSVALTGYFKDLGLVKGRYYRLYRRYIDFNTDKILEALSQIDSENESSLFEHVLTDPNAWAEEEQQQKQEEKAVGERTVSSDARATALKLRDNFRMSPSQKDISASIIKKRLQIVWGPPGSGKTEFLALFINWYITHLHDRENGKAFVIGVTAFTRHAITNLLKRIADVQMRHRTSTDSKTFTIVTMESASSSNGSSPAVLPDAIHCKAEQLPKHLPQKGAVVVGGTVWDWYKAQKKTTKKCDMMIIDESSQLLVPDAAIAINCLDSKKGRLIIAGDHMQLGPILHNTYPKLPLKEPLLFGSIQQCMMRTTSNESIPPQEFLLKKGARRDFGPNTIQLKDNWRMNDELNSFFKQIYGNDLASHYPNQRLKYDWTRVAASHRHLHTIRTALDPRKAITVINIKLKKAHAVEEETEVEAKIVADIVEAHLQAQVTHGNSSNDVAKVMVATPHHRQRVAVEHQVSLRRGYTFREQVTVNTVEKMQGQECELVIACFAFHDITPTKIDFLLDFKRWNVTVSRARCKVIIVTTDDILSLPNRQGGHSLALFEKRESAEGWGFVCMVQEWAKKADALVNWDA